MIKGVLRNFAKFTGKHLCQNLFMNISEKTELNGSMRHIEVFLKSGIPIYSKLWKGIRRKNGNFKVLCFAK